VFSVHADMDATVPYESGYFKEPFLNTPVLFVYGSKAIQTHANTLTIPNDLYTYNGTNHPVHITQELMDTTINFISRKLVTQLKCYNGTPLGTKLTTEHNVSFTIFPNPTNDFINIYNNANAKVQIFNINGKLVFESKNKSMIRLNNLDKGIYLVRFSNSKTNTSLEMKKIIVQ